MAEVNDLLLDVDYVRALENERERESEASLFMLMLMIWCSNYSTPGCRRPVYPLLFVSTNLASQSVNFYFLEPSVLASLNRTEVWFPACSSTSCNGCAVPVLDACFFFIPSLSPLASLRLYTVETHLLECNGHLLLERAFGQAHSSNDEARGTNQ